MAVSAEEKEIQRIKLAEEKEAHRLKLLEEKEAKDSSAAKFDKNLKIALSIGGSILAAGVLGNQIYNHYQPKLSTAMQYIPALPRTPKPYVPPHNEISRPTNPRPFGSDDVDMFAAGYGPAINPAWSFERAFSDPRKQRFEIPVGGGGKRRRV